MYKYTVTNNIPLSSSDKKKAIKSFIHALIRVIKSPDIISFIIILFLFHLLNIFNYFIFLITCLTIILLQCIVFFIKINNNSNQHLPNFEPVELNISFDKDGFKSFNNELIREINWNGIKEITIYDDKFSISYKISCIPENTYYFNNFEVSKDTIISDIEKYKKVRWC